MHDIPRIEPGQERLLALLREVGANEAADRHQRLAAQDRHLDPLAWASFDEIRGVARRAGVLAILASHLERSEQALNQEIVRVRDFRNDVAQHEHHDAGRETARHEGVADRADEVHTG